MEKHKTLKRSESDQAVFEMVHDLERISPYLKSINDYIQNGADSCPARKDYEKIVVILDRVMGEGCKRLREVFND